MGNTIIAISNKVLFILARCSIRYGVLKNFANFTEKHLCWSLFLIEMQVFTCEICEIFKNTFFEERLWWMW